MKGSPVLTDINVADEVWVATALLHFENPQRLDFEVKEILERARQENIHGAFRPGIQTHVSSHCVAGKKPNPGRYRMLHETASGRRRLYRIGDPIAPGRVGKIVPQAEAIPAQYRYLLEWYSETFSPQAKAGWLNQWNALAGTGKRFLDGMNADEYVRRLREGWE